MVSKVCALFAALGAACTTAGCVEEQLAPPATPPAPYRALSNAALQTVGSPGPQDRRFGETLSAYAQEVSRVHAVQERRADATISWAVLQLATILESMPAAAAQPRLRRAAEAIRRSEGDLGGGDVEPEPAPIERTKQSMAIAATALLQLAQSHYREATQIAAAARVFAAAVEGIDAEKTPPDRAALIAALTRAQRVLAGMYAVNVAPSSSVTPEVRPEPVERREQPRSRDR
jgi:hypothetical protein